MSEETNDAEPESGDLVDSGAYEVIRARLLKQVDELNRKAEELNARRIEAFGGTELTVISNTRVRTENNCVPRDIIQVDGRLLFGFNVSVFQRDTTLNDVFSFHELQESEEGWEIASLPTESVAFLNDASFQKDFKDLYSYYKEARLTQLMSTDSRLFAVYRIGHAISDVKVLRWELKLGTVSKYIDNRGDREYQFPTQHDFSWKATSRDDHVDGKHPHINILDACFVETTGGNLTIKVENNTASGEGVYSERVEDKNQSLADADVQYSQVGTLILLRIKPYREEQPRYLVFNTRTHQVNRIDAIGSACVQLPENHGLIFPGGYYLQDGETKIFEGDTEGLLFKRKVLSPNGEDVLFVFHRKEDGHYTLLPYNLIRKEVQNPIHCHGYSLFDDGRMVVFRAVSEEPTRVHPMQVWQTPFTSAEFADAAPVEAGFLGKVGNADLVRGISDSFTIWRMARSATPTRQIYEDLIAGVVRMTDAYYWLEHTAVGDLASSLQTIRRTVEQLVDEFEKVQIIQKRAREALREAREKQEDIVLSLRPDSWQKVEEFMEALTSLRNHRGHLITLRDLRYMDVASLETLEKESAEEFERVSKAAVQFLLEKDALGPLSSRLETLLERIEKVEKGSDLPPIVEALDAVSNGLDVLSEIIAGLQVDDATARTKILEDISEVYANLNRVRATLQNKRKEVLSREGRAEFAAQFQLFAQSVTSALSLADTPAKCDESLSRLMVQIEELEGRFGEFDEFLGDLTQKREEVYEAFGAKKQQLLDEKQRRSQSLAGAAKRILEGTNRRARSFKELDALNAYFASDPMILKLRDIVERLRALNDNVKADELESALKAARQDALRGYRDRRDLFEGDANLIRFGRHRFTVNTQKLELSVVPRDGAMAFHLTGTDFYQLIDDEAFLGTKEFWEEPLISESRDVYRGEYLAASILFDAESGQHDLSLPTLQQATLVEGKLLELVRKRAGSRYDEGYERGVHDVDAAHILEKLLSLRSTAGLLRFAPMPRAMACLFWAYTKDSEQLEFLRRRGRSFGRLRESFHHSDAIVEFQQELADHLYTFATAQGLSLNDSEARVAGEYLAEELMSGKGRFATSAEAQTLRERLQAHLDRAGQRNAFEEDLRSLGTNLAHRYTLARSWLRAYVDAEAPALSHAVSETAVLYLTEETLDRDPRASLAALEVTGLLGQHARIQDGQLTLRLDSFLERMGEFVHQRVPKYRRYRELRHELIERKRTELRLEEFKPRVLSSFVRNRLIQEVYLPIVGDNLAKQLGAAGAGARTDRMGLLLLVSPPGYGKTTLMEYLANQLGLVFMKVNGPSLGHSVVSLDPEEAPNATARQEVNKINLALEMGNNVMLYLDDVQHTDSEFLQKFISLCDAQRRIEGVWNGKTRTYDLRGKKFCVIMAGNPYNESGEKFQIPDMLANRADTYNLGEVLDGKEEQFALSYLENSLTSNPVLAPVAARSLDDIYRFIRMSQGEEVPTTDLDHSYSGVEIEEVNAVLQKLFVCRDVLLKVNAQYVASAAQADEYRTEPPFQLQGSYRNMNKLAEKVVAAMNDEELKRLIDDHYAGESQTLTSGAEQNLLKLGEMRESLDTAQLDRWKTIKKEYVRLRAMGGEDDAVSRVTGSLTNLGREIDGIGKVIEDAIKLQQSDAQELSERDEKRSTSVVKSLHAMSDAIVKGQATTEKASANQTARMSTEIAKLLKGLSKLEQAVSKGVDAQEALGGEQLKRLTQDSQAITAQLAGIQTVMETATEYQETAQKADTQHDNKRTTQLQQGLQRIEAALQASVKAQRDDMAYEHQQSEKIRLALSGIENALHTAVKTQETDIAHENQQAEVLRQAIQNIQQTLASAYHDYRARQDAIPEESNQFEQAGLEATERGLMGIQQAIQYAVQAQEKRTAESMQRAEEWRSSEQVRSAKIRGEEDAKRTEQLEIARHNAEVEARREAAEARRIEQQSELLRAQLDVMQRMTPQPPQGDETAGGVTKITLNTPPAFERLLAQQVEVIERTLIPMVQSATHHLGQTQAVQEQLQQILQYLRHLDAQLRQR